jgi:hypothetical protein
MHMRRFTRRSNGFSKKIENHANEISLHFANDSFSRIHKRLLVTPAIATGATDRIWEMADLLVTFEVAEAWPKRRGPYKNTE